MRYYRSLVVLLFITKISFGQTTDSSLYIPDHLLRNTTFTHYTLADSFSKAGDSVNASAHFVKVNPYILIDYVQPAALETFFARYLLTNAARNEYRRKYEQVYNAPKTEPYKKFKAMFEEDQDVRNKLDTCSNDTICGRLKNLMRTTDTAHFAWLYNYVAKNGWPTIENGSMYAIYIALHDHAKYNHYIPILKKAVLAGIAAPGVYVGILANYSGSKFIDPNKMLELLNSLKFDVSMLLRNTLPDSVTYRRINNAIRNHCHIKFFALIYEANDERQYEKFKKEVHAADHRGITYEFERSLNWLNCKAYQGIFYKFHYQPVAKPKLKLVLIY